jgi:hypothetical protein
MIYLDPVFDLPLRIISGRHQIVNPYHIEPAGKYELEHSSKNCANIAEAL